MMATPHHSKSVLLNKHGARVLFWTTVLATLLLVLSTVVALAFSQSQFVSFTLEGCRFFAGLTLPDSLGRYVCLDSNYTTGNLAKGWNELDLVPHRLTTSLGNQENATTDYNVYIAADYQTGGKTGYDVISVPVLNASKSDASCSISAGPQSTSGSATKPFGGGTDVVIYRELAIHQNKSTTCVFDYYQRLALGSHLYSGSSLQSYMFEQDGLSGSKKTLSIPVNEILPQSVNKDMTASQAAAYTWDVTKSPSPANLSFSDTCDAQRPKSQGVQITVTWERLSATPGKITAITHIYATNPSAREVTVNVTDKIYAGITPSGAVLDEDSSGPVNVPANTANFLLLTHIEELDPGPTSLNDVATATYTDLVTGLPVPGNATATSSAPVQVTYTNAAAVINDLESITGTGLSYSADSFMPSIGGFDDGYLPGTPTAGQVSWTSVSQNGNNSVTFNKTVFVAGPSQVNGKLHDVATLSGSDGFGASSTADVVISTDARVSLTIMKNIDRVLSSDQTFTFKVKDSVATTVATPSITIPAGQVSGSTTVSNLTPAEEYTISEDPLIGWVYGPDQTKTINLPSCSGEVNFSNISAQDLTVSKTTVAAFNRAYSWDIYKNVDKTRVNIAEGSLATFNYTVGVTHDTGTDSGWTVSGQITVNNPNGFDVAGVNITDAIDHGGTCTVMGGTGLTIPANGSVTRSYSCTFTTAPGSGTNTATATWNASTYNTPSGAASGTKGYDFSIVMPGISAGSVTVTDTLGGALGAVSYTDPSPKEFSYSHSFPGTAGTCTDYDNTATILETEDFAKQTVKVCVGKDLTIAKTVDPRFTRTYLWQITKGVDQTLVTLPGGGTATFNYTVGVTQTGFADSAWGLAGKITITNPNDWEAIPLTGISDSVAPGWDCTVPVPVQKTYYLSRRMVLLPVLMNRRLGAITPQVGAAPQAVADSTVDLGLEVPADGSIQLDYTCTWVGAGSPGNGTNTATVTWDKEEYATPAGSANGEKGFTFTTPTTTVNKNVTITDLFNGNLTTLGTVIATDGPPFATATFSYPRHIPVSFGCQSYPNTARIVETNQTADQLVTVCGPTQTGARTMGFWQNKNGQGIIKNAGNVAGTTTCKLTPWLRQFAPYQDLSATANCTQAATYIYTVIKAANAGGATLNPMLKAQMLATALDVYFSDPALGGNKLGSPAPIGGFTVDLTKVCSAINPGCTLEDASSAFGGSSQTVLQMLAYAASQSNIGGNPWYANVKSTQELAKDAFDAINNQVAVSP